MDLSTQMKGKGISQEARAALAGISWGERRRLDRLSRSGSLIDNQDEPRVRAWIECRNLVEGSLLMNLLITVTSFLFGIGGIFGVLVGVFVGSVQVVIQNGLIASFAIYLLVAHRRRLRARLATACVNGWDAASQAKRARRLSGPRP
jgi:hypothetical protein